MAWKNLKQKSLADNLIVHHAALEELDGVNELIDWSRIEALLVGTHNKRRGEQAWPPLMMFQALLLQSWYRLSNWHEIYCFAVLSISALASLSPDHSTLWRFRNLLEEGGLFKQLLDAINQQLSEQSLLIRSGEVSIIDASVIEAKNARPRKDKDGNNTQDKDAGWNVKQGSDGKKKTTYGYKAHMNVEEDGFIKTYEVTAGNVHDSQVFEDLLTGAGAETAAYADSAYKSQAHDALLKAKGISNRILKRAYRNKPLTAQEKRENRNNASTRTVVERVFSVLKFHQGMSKSRYLGLTRNEAWIGLLSVTHNIKRGMMLHRRSYS